MAWRLDLFGSKHHIDECEFAADNCHDMRVINGGEKVDRGDGTRDPIKYHVGPIGIFCTLCGTMLPTNKPIPTK